MEEIEAVLCSCDEVEIPLMGRYGTRSGRPEYNRFEFAAMRRLIELKASGFAPAICLTTQ